MILVATAAIAFSIAHDGTLSRTTSLAPIATATKASAADQPTPYENRNIPVDRFDRLKVSGPFKVGVLIGTEPPHILLVGPPALLGDIIARVEGDTLVIRFREGATWSWNPGSGVNIVVFASRLNAVRLEGAATIEVNGVRGDMLSAATDGSGTIVVRQLNVEHVELETSGAGGITVEGSARDAVYVVSGSGSIDAKRLRVERATIAIGSSGSAYADVSRTANVSVTGAGRLNLVGGAACMEQPIHSPQVDCR